MTREVMRFQRSDRRDLLDLLISVCKTVGEGEAKPCIEVDGKLYQPHEHLKVALLLPDQDLQPHHQATIDAMFQKRQHGYIRTGCNLWCTERTANEGGDDHLPHMRPAHARAAWLA